MSFVNINGIGAWAKSEKSEDIRRYMISSSVDIMGVSEIGVNWSKVHNSHTIWERTKKWFRTRRIRVSCNTTQTITGRLQQGGTATLIAGEVAHRVKKSGFDDTGLGRWSWVVITGKQQCTLDSVYTAISATKK